MTTCLKAVRTSFFKTQWAMVKSNETVFILIAVVTSREKIDTNFQRFEAHSSHKPIERAANLVSSANIKG